MMWFYENLEAIVFGIFVAGVTLHFPARWLERQNYLDLRAAYEGALRHTRETRGAPAAVVRQTELYRAFMRSSLPGWFDGFGKGLRLWLKFCAVFTLVAFFFRGPIMRGEEEYAKKQAHFESTEEKAKGRPAKVRTAQRRPRAPRSQPSG